MLKLQDISADTVLFPWAKRAPRRALESTLAVAIALAVGHASGHASAGAIAAGAAFTVGFAVFHEAMASTLVSMAFLTAGVASATLAGSLAAQWTWAVLLMAILASVNYGLLSELGPTTGWIGQQCGVFVIIASGFPLGVHYAVGRASMVVLGGVLQMMLYSVSYYFYPHFVEPATPPHVAGSIQRRLRKRLHELWASLERSVHKINADTVGYIVRLALTLVLATLFYRHRHLGNGYWAPMTALLVLKPQWAATLSRGSARLLGTVAGATLAVLSGLYLPTHQPLVFVLVLICAWACFALQAVNYALFSLFLTLYTVYSFRYGGFSQPAAAHFRVLNTAIGGGIALAVDLAWIVFAWIRARLWWKPQTSSAPQAVSGGESE